MSISLISRNKIEGDLKLKTLDLLRIVCATLLAGKGLVNVFTTLDNEILAKGYLLEKLGLNFLIHTTLYRANL